MRRGFARFGKCRTRIAVFLTSHLSVGESQSEKNIFDRGTPQGFYRVPSVKTHMKANMKFAAIRTSRKIIVGAIVL